MSGIDNVIAFPNSLSEGDAVRSDVLRRFRAAIETYGADAGVLVFAEEMLLEGYAHGACGDKPEQFAKEVIEPLEIAKEALIL